MYEPYRQETETRISFKFYWDKNTMQGLGIAICLAFIVSMLLTTCDVNPYSIKELERSDSTLHVPTVILIFGEGDGTGARKGNLTEEGAASKGDSPSNSLENAQKAGSTEYSPNSTPQNPDDASNLIPRAQIKTGSKNVTDRNGSDSRNVGTKNGTPGGTGLGTKGTGAGSGLGWGDIDWGGGGNRIPRNTPKPPGDIAKQNTTLKVKITVAPDGSVRSVIPVLKGGDADLERTVRKYLMKWTFNPIKADYDMVGIITIISKVR